MNQRSNINMAHADRYLSLLGVTIWLPRYGKAQNLQCFNLLSDKKPVGLLISESMDIEEATFINNLFRAIGLTREPITDINASPLFFAVGKRSKQYLDELFPDHLNKFVIEQPKSLLASPIQKQQLWEKLRVICHWFSEK